MGTFGTDLLDKVSNIDLLSCCKMTQKYIGDDDFFETHCFGTSIKVAFAVNQEYGLRFGEDYPEFNKVKSADIGKFIEFVQNSNNTLFTLYAFHDGPRLVPGDDGHSMSVITHNGKFYILESRYRQHTPQIEEVDAERVDDEIYDLFFQGGIEWLSCEL